MKGILGVVGACQRAATDAPDHRGTTPGQRIQREAIVAAHEALEQLAIALFLVFEQQRRSPERIQKPSDGIGRLVFLTRVEDRPLLYLVYYRLPTLLSVSSHARLEKMGPQRDRQWLACRPSYSLDPS